MELSALYGGGDLAAILIALKVVKNDSKLWDAGCFDSSLGSICRPKRILGYHVLLQRICFILLGKSIEIPTELFCV